MIKTKKLWKSIITYCLVICMMLSSATIALASDNQGFSNDISDEILQMRTTSSQTFKLADGTFRTDIYGADVFHIKNGEFVEIDNTIIKTNEKDYLFQNKSNSYTSKFAKISPVSPMMSISYEGYAFFMYPTTKNKNNKTISDFIEPVLSESIVKKQNNDSLCEFEKDLVNDNRVIWYKNVYENVDYVYTSIHDGVKEDIILRDVNVPSEYSFIIDTDNLKLNIDEERLYLVDSVSGKQVFEISESFMEDAEGKSSKNLKWEISSLGGKDVLTVHIDDEFLNSNTTVFPVRIDPTFITKGTNYTSDTYTSSANPTTNYVTNNYLRTGKDSPYGIRRSYIRFKLPSGYKASGITSATLQLTLYSKGSSAINPRVYSSSGYWKSNQIVYDAATNSTRKNVSNYTGTAITPSVSGNTYSFNVLTPIKNCYLQNNSNFGFVIRDSNESNTNAWGTFYSSDHSSASYIPTLSITYSSVAPTNHYKSGSWSGASPHDLVGYSDDNASYVSNAFFNWNSIDDNIYTSTLNYASSYLPYSEIRIMNDSTTSMPSNYYAATLNYDSSNTGTWTGVWKYSVIRLNKRSDSIFTPLHNDLKEEIVTHEVGHSLSLTHYEKDTEPTTCIMQQYYRYCYPNPTSHDKNNIKNKY